MITSYGVYVGEHIYEKCPGGIAPNRLEVDEACDSSTEAYWSRVLDKIRPEAFLMARHAPRAAAAGAVSVRHDFDVSPVLRCRPYSCACHENDQG